MIHAYQTKTLPKLLEVSCQQWALVAKTQHQTNNRLSFATKELEECHLDTSLSISSALLASSELVAEKVSFARANQRPTCALPAPYLRPL